MTDDEVPPRWETRASIEKLTMMFGLRSDPHMQDWEIEAADPRILERLVDAYGNPTFSDDDRFALMSLIIGSIDKAKHEGADISDVWPRVARILAANAPLHAYTMTYWSCGEDSDPDHQFSITPEIRSVWCTTKGGLT
jgi:hypothetical protein